MTPSLPRVSENVPVKSLIAVTQTVIGFGAGLLIAEKLAHRARRNTALALFGAGIAAFLPVIISLVTSVVDSPESERRMRKRLDSIRRNTGLSDSENAF